MKKRIAVLLVLAAVVMIPLTFAQEKSVQPRTTALEDSIPSFVLGSGVVQEREIFKEEKETKTCSGSCDGVPVTSWTCPKDKECLLNCTTNPPTGSCV